MTAGQTLEHNKGVIDALNVFPVPDGDTGTNLSLTMSSAVNEVSRETGDSVAAVSQAAAMGSLMGARGNSGVIMSQLLRGIAKGLEKVERASGRQLAHALHQGVEVAYKAVMRPVEGTILTVARQAAQAAQEAADKGVDVVGVWDAALNAAQHTLTRTPEMLPVLKQAGVVDAGGKGLVYFFEAGLEVLTGKTQNKVESVAARQVDFVVTEDMGDIEFPYDAQFLVKGEDMSLGQMRSGLEGMGDSLLVVGSPQIARVHIHTDRPGEVLNICLKYGELSQIIIDNMVEQHQQLTAEPKAETVVPSASAPPSMPVSPVVEEDAEKPMGVVVVAPGDGLARIFESLGVDHVIHGGQTMNPSTQDVANAVRNVNARRVVFLPNNPNIIMAAKQAKRLLGRRMYVVPTRNVPQGLAALLSLKPDASMSSNLKRAARALRSVKSLEVTYAVRKSKFDGHVIQVGDTLGLLNDKIRVVGEGPEQVLLDLLQYAVNDKDEVASIFYGADVKEETVQEIEDVLCDQFPHLDIELHCGGQPFYYYIVSVE